MQPVETHQVPATVAAQLAAAPEHILSTGTTLADLASAKSYHWTAIAGWVAQWEEEAGNTTARVYFRCDWNS